MTTCEHADCRRPVKAHGLCQMHYDRERSRAGRRREDRVLATRARNRANAALIKAHPDEFATLLEKSQREVLAEHERIVALAAEMGVEPTTDQQIFRLKRGPAADDEAPEDRVQLNDPTTCTCCQRTHERGHSCPECGTAVGMPVERATSTPEVRELAGDIVRERERETKEVLASYDGLGFSDPYRARIPAPDDWDWDDEASA